jgi:hypothetical protein
MQSSVNVTKQCHLFSSSKFYGFSWISEVFVSQNNLIAFVYVFECRAFATIVFMLYDYHELLMFLNK